MIKSVLVFLIILAGLQVSAADGCVNFAAKYAIDRVTNEMILSGDAIYDHDFFLSTPEFSGQVLVNGTSIKKYSTVVSVSPKSGEPSVTRYNVTLSINDQGATCFLVSGSSSVDLEN